MTVTLCTSGTALRKAGSNVSSTVTASGAMIENFINQAESTINVNTRYNWVDAYSGLDDDVKMILEEVASNLAAIYCINYDMSSIGRKEAETRVDILWARFTRILRTLEDKKQRTFMGA